MQANHGNDKPICLKIDLAGAEPPLGSDLTSYIFCDFPVLMSIPKPYSFDSCQAPRLTDKPKDHHLTQVTVSN